MKFPKVIVKFLSYAHSALAIEHIRLRAIHNNEPFLDGYCFAGSLFRSQLADRMVNICKASVSISSGELA